MSLSSIDRRVLVLCASILIVLGGGIAAAAYLAVSNETVYIEKSQIEAPVVELAPTTGGVLRSLTVKAGDTVVPNTVVAQVGVELIKSTAGGLVLLTHGDVGDTIAAGETVVETIDPAQLRVVGDVQEDKGLSAIKVGQVAAFTVDAFGGKTFSGIVDEIAPVANSGDVVFSISDKREEQLFDVKVRFDTISHSELKQGMSAKLWVYKR